MNRYELQARAAMKGKAIYVRSSEQANKVIAFISAMPGSKSDKVRAASLIYYKVTK